MSLYDDIRARCVADREELTNFLRSWHGRDPTAEELRIAARDKLWADCERLSAKEEGMTVAQYRALNERRRVDPFCQ